MTRPKLWTTRSTWPSAWSRRRCRPVPRGAGVIVTGSVVTAGEARTLLVGPRERERERQRAASERSARERSSRNEYDQYDGEQYDGGQNGDEDS